jgi:hypothetical protein
VNQTSFTNFLNRPSPLEVYPLSSVLISALIGTLISSLKLYPSLLYFTSGLTFALSPQGSQDPHASETQGAHRLCQGTKGTTLPILQMMALTIPESVIVQHVMSTLNIRKPDYYRKPHTMLSRASMICAA